MTTGQIQTLTKALARRFPSLPIWFGEHTGHWWALADNRLIEADSAGELGLVLDRLVAPQLAVDQPADRAEPYAAPTISAAATPPHTRPAAKLSPWRRLSGLWAPVPAW